jgi:hypothetical protein
LLIFLIVVCAARPLANRVSDGDEFIQSLALSQVVTEFTGLLPNVLKTNLAGGGVLNERPHTAGLSASQALSDYF